VGQDRRLGQIFKDTHKPEDMKKGTQRPKFNAVAAFIAALGMEAILAKKANEKEVDPAADKDEFRYAGYGAHFGAPIYSPRRGKFKGYMREKTTFNKRR